MYKAPRGTRDILPSEQNYWHLLREHIRRITTLYGYERIDTPLFEETGLFARGIGEGTDIVTKEMYTFEDKGGDSLTLLPEITASIMRAYLEHGMHTLPQPVRLYSILPVFRYERPQAGRFRQHYQFDCEALGEQDPALDAEIIILALRFYEQIGARNLMIQLNSIGCPKCRPPYIDSLVEYYTGKEDQLCVDCRMRLERNPLRLLDCKKKTCQPLIEQAPKSLNYLCSECAAHFASLREHLDDTDIVYDLNHRLVRGLDYYTRTVFEIWAPGIGAQNAVCGGGRYDGLATALGGRNTPAIGFAIGMERAILTMKEQGILPDLEPAPKVFLAYHGEEAKRNALKLTDEMRTAGTRAIMAFGNHSLKSQMKEADRKKARYAIVLGERELAEKEATVRDLASGVETHVALGEIVNWLGKRLQEGKA